MVTYVKSEKRTGLFQPSMNATAVNILEHFHLYLYSNKSLGNKSSVEHRLDHSKCS